MGKFTLRLGYNGSERVWKRLKVTRYHINRKTARSPNTHLHPRHRNWRRLLFANTEEGEDNPPPVAVIDGEEQEMLMSLLMIAYDEMGLWGFPYSCGLVSRHSGI